MEKEKKNVTSVLYTCFGPWPFNLFFPVLFDWAGVLWPNYLKCWNLCTGPAASSFPQCPCRSRSSLVRAAAYAYDSGERLYCFLVGVQIKSYVILTATSDLWLFIHASNLLPLLTNPAPLQSWRWRAELEVEESHTNREVSGAVWRPFKRTRPQTTWQSNHRAEPSSHQSCHASLERRMEGTGSGSEGSRLEAWLKSHKSEVAITELLFAPTRKQRLCWKRHKQTKYLEHESKNKE